jgi:hypothetical protein
MESGAKGCEVIVSGKLRAQRAKSMKFKVSMARMPAAATAAAEAPTEDQQQCIFCPRSQQGTRQVDEGCAHQQWKQQPSASWLQQHCAV